MKVAIVDLGCGNLGSVGQALDRAKVRHFATPDPDEIAAAERVILPGVGAAGFAMRRINALGLAPVLRSLSQPALAICLGMHLLFDRSEEGGVDCLGIIAGSVRALTPSSGYPVPHMGWSRIELAAEVPGINCSDYFYFAHSFAADVGSPTVATAVHSRPIAAAVRHENWLGVQFHPERSGLAGARLIQAFLA